MILSETEDTFIVDNIWYKLPSQTHKRNLVANCHVAHGGRAIKIFDNFGNLVATAENSEIDILH